MAQHTKLREALRLCQEDASHDSLIEALKFIEGDSLACATFSVLSDYVQAHPTLLGIASLRLYYLHLSFTATRWQSPHKILATAVTSEWRTCYLPCHLRNR